MALGTAEARGEGGEVSGEAELEPVWVAFVAFDACVWVPVPLADGVTVMGAPVCVELAEPLSVEFCAPAHITQRSTSSTRCGEATIAGREGRIVGLRGKCGGWVCVAGEGGERGWGGGRAGLHRRPPQQGHVKCAALTSVGGKRGDLWGSGNLLCVRDPLSRASSAFSRRPAAGRQHAAF